jgi:cell pole-organizing protein PopZ
MSKSARVPEPSMEEILASIRRIIADDSNAPAQAASTTAEAESEMHASASREPAPSATPDVLDLTQPVEPGSTPAFTPVRGSDVMFREEDRRPSPAAPLPSPVRAPAPPMHNARGPGVRDDLMSPSSTAAVSAAFNSLASTVLSDNARTLEDIVKEMMRPMLKAWLDENLPGLVERMVRAEIERVSRGGH